MTISTVVRLLFVYVFMIVLTATITALLGGYQPSREIYIFLLKLTALWCGLVWISIAVYLILISETPDFVSVAWLSFVIGALMVYIGIGGGFHATKWWLGVRTVLYLLLSISAVMMFHEIKRTGGLDEPDDRIRIVLSRKKLKRAFDPEFWRNK